MFAEEESSDETLLEMLDSRDCRKLDLGEESVESSSFRDEGKIPKEIDIPEDNAAEREEMSALLLSTFLHSKSKVELLDEDVFTKAASQRSQLSEEKTCACCKRKENIAAIGFGYRCLPLRNRSVSVEGPNGAKCVEVIEECQCSKSCFRMAFMESFYEWIWNKTSNATEERIKDIDVGRCVGSCEDFKEDQFQCVLRDPSDSNRCLMSLRKSAPRCVPLQFSTHSFSTKEGALKTVLAVDQCGC
ncbi:uncharacterized protein LOC111086143 [Limulus polyphemus]|uniref:Uncharacterized protein LOC111086143 n=1 Tax=Limulus polyphemus TaxID=6850 RepID=A0ABM1SIR9_LIMPO|nr:uncharacterized protein LOC111086143 [Limulus polyphemus]